LFVLRFRSGNHRGGQLLQHWNEHFALQIAQDLVEHQVVDVKDGIGGDKRRHVSITRPFIALVELRKHSAGIVIRRGNHKPILRKQLQLALAQVYLTQIRDVSEGKRQGVSAWITLR